MLSWCKVLLPSAQESCGRCCAGMLLISWREFREDRERGELQNVLYSKRRSSVCKINTRFLLFFFFFFLFPLLEVCYSLTRVTEGSAVACLVQVRLCRRRVSLAPEWRSPRKERVGKGEPLYLWRQMSASLPTEALGVVAVLTPVHPVHQASKMWVF